MAEYDLDALGWYQFERLCQSLLKSRCGLAVEAWGRSGDRGRDAYSEEDLRFPAEELNRGPFIFQVKFVNGANASGAKPIPALLDGVRKELRRIDERRDAGQWSDPRHYALLTNVPLDGDRRVELSKILNDRLPNSEILIQDAADIDSLLDASPQVRLAFPQVLGLRDIFALLNERVNKDILTRSSLAVEIASERAQSFVATEAYAKALNVLGSKHFVVLTGPPEMGKTTIAWMVALARLSGEWEAYECRTPEDFFAVHEPDRAQVFVVDDAFGSTEYQPDRASLWADELEKVLRALDYRHWLLLTSRPAPLKIALERLNLKGTEEEFPLPQQVLVDASALSVQEKAQMLYRHAKSAVASERGRLLIRDVARELVNHEHFTPLRIRRFVANQVPAILDEPEDEQSTLMTEAVASNLERPTAEMTTSFRQLPGECKTLLISMLDSSASTIRLEDLAVAFERHLGRAPEHSAEATARLIDDHFIRISRFAKASGEDGEIVQIEWVHPSVRDLVIDHLTSSAEARRAFLARARIDGVMLALSSEGGAGGERLFPLLESSEDWAEIKGRIGALPGEGNAFANARLAALLEDTARLASAQEAAEHAEDLRALTRDGLEAISKHWSAAGKALSNGELRSFYRASATLLPPVAGPDLSATWELCIEMVARTVFEEPGEEIHAAEEWLELADLLRRYEPRWLIGLGFPDSYRTVSQEVLDRIESVHDALDRPTPTESEDLSEYAEPPPNLEWVDSAEQVLALMEGLDSELDERCETLPARIDEKSSEWHLYGEHHEAYVERARGEEGDYEEHHREHAEVFDISEFFADL